MFCYRCNYHGNKDKEVDNHVNKRNIRPLLIVIIIARIMISSVTMNHHESEAGTSQSAYALMCVFVCALGACTCGCRCVCVLPV